MLLYYEIFNKKIYKGAGIRPREDKIPFYNDRVRSSQKF